jgi:hypothetical protein
MPHHFTRGLKLKVRTDSYGWLNAAAIEVSQVFKKDTTRKQRWNAHQKLSDQEANDATLVTAYVCAIVDLERDLVHRATLLSGALDSDKKKKQHLDRQLLDGIRKTVPILLPPATSDFDAADLSQRGMRMRRFGRPLPPGLPPPCAK